MARFVKEREPELVVALVAQAELDHRFLASRPVSRAAEMCAAELRREH